MPMCQKAKNSEKVIFEIFGQRILEKSDSIVPKVCGGGGQAILEKYHKQSTYFVRGLPLVGGWGEESYNGH